MPDPKVPDEALDGIDFDFVRGDFRSRKGRTRQILAAFLASDWFRAHYVERDRLQQVGAQFSEKESPRTPLYVILNESSAGE